MYPAVDILLFVFLKRKSWVTLKLFQTVNLLLVLLHTADTLALFVQHARLCVINDRELKNVKMGLGSSGVFHENQSITVCTQMSETELGDLENDTQTRIRSNPFGKQAS
jgi:hypothetical protein